MYSNRNSICLFWCSTSSWRQLPLPMKDGLFRSTRFRCICDLMKRDVGLQELGCDVNTNGHTDAYGVFTGL